MKNKIIAAISLMCVFIGLLADFDDAATQLAIISPILAPVIPLIGIGGVVFCFLFLCIQFYFYTRQLFDTRRANYNRTVLDLLGLVLQRLEVGDPLTSRGYFSKYFSEEREETKLLMDKICKLGMGPSLSEKHAKHVSPESIDRYGETVWIEHLQKVRPIVKIYGIKAAREESKRINKEREYM